MGNGNNQNGHHNGNGHVPANPVSRNGNGNGHHPNGHVNLNGNGQNGHHNGNGVADIGGHDLLWDGLPPPWSAPWSRPWTRPWSPSARAGATGPTTTSRATPSSTRPTRYSATAGGVTN